jgi:hypothetical protein
MATAGQRRGNRGVYFYLLSPSFTFHPARRQKNTEKHQPNLSKLPELTKITPGA